MSANYSQLINFRKDLHAHPEVSGHEEQTALRVKQFLSSCNPNELISGIGGHGIIATWDSGVPGKEIVFRAELDALPIQEINDFDYKSVYEGVSHKCGHDGHSTILCGLAHVLATKKLSSGKVRLLFQPAEENGEGAKAMLEDKILSDFNPDFVFALHNLPGYPLGAAIIRDQTFTAAVSSIIINLEGKTSHAAEPEHGINPALAIGEILKESLAAADNNPAKENMRVVTPVYVEMGEKAYGISAGRGSVHLTIRCWNDENLEQLENDIEDISNKIAAKHQLKVSFDYTQIFHANMNHSIAADLVRKGVLSAGNKIHERDYPFKWGEDFGLFTARFPGCMFGLGAGENMPALHNPDYDFPDSLIEHGVNIFCEIIDETLNFK